MHAEMGKIDAYAKSDFYNQLRKSILNLHRFANTKNLFNIYEQDALLL